MFVFLQLFYVCVCELFVIVLLVLCLQIHFTANLSEISKFHVKLACVLPLVPVQLGSAEPSK